MSQLIIGSIKKHRQKQPKIYVCPELLARSHIGKQITIQYGQATTSAIVDQSSQNKNVHLSTPVWEALSIPFPHKMHMRMEEGRLKLGPLVGILTCGIMSHYSNPLRIRTNLMRRFLQTQKELPVSYFIFSPHDIATDEQRVHGTFLRQKNGHYYWERHVLPFPAVVYNRLPNRQVEQYPATQRAKQILSEAGIPLFNPDFFNKWTIHHNIYQRPEAQQYIPETLFHPTLMQLDQFVRKHGMIYLKPANGSLGLGIIQIYRSQQHYITRYRQRHENKLRRFSDLYTAMSHFPRPRSSSAYIAQQGIHLLTIDNRPIDFRVHTNKNRSGKWEMTAIAAKIAGKGSVTTHMRTGGKVLSHKKVLKHCFPNGEDQNVIKKLKKAVLTLSESIEHSLPGYFGEFGFDIGIDQNGHPWMFEANSKPGRHVFIHPSMKGSERLTRIKVVDHTLYLSDFANKEVYTS